MKTITIRSVDANENASLCAPCGGTCCKGMPGIYHPDDLFEGMSDLQIKEKMIEMLKEGNTVITDSEITLDFDQSRIVVKSLTPRAETNRGVWYASFNYGQCTHLKENGCELSSVQRPMECRALVPGKNQICQPAPWFSRMDLLEEWMIYEEIFEEVSEYHSEHIATRL